MSTLAKQQIGARVHDKAHLALGEVESKRFFGSLYNEPLVSGTVLRVEKEAGKRRVRIFLTVGWESLAGQRDRRISVAEMALVWVDRERRYFISSASSAAAGTPYERLRWLQTETCPERVPLTVEQPQCAEINYSACARIDQHNRCRQDDLGLDRTYVTHDCSATVGFSLLGMVIVDAWLLHTGSRRPLQTMKQNEFYEQLALDLGDNNYDAVGLRDRMSVAEDAVELTPTSDLSPHTTPSKKRKRTRDGTETSVRPQKDCVVCGKRTTRVCSQCLEECSKEVFICDSSKGRICFTSHLHSTHS